SMLQCLTCKSESDQCNDTHTQQCEPDKLCFSTRYKMYSSVIHMSEAGVKHACIERDQCDHLEIAGSDVLFSANVGVAHGSVFFSCCETDNCNNFTLPEPDTRPNGLKCFTCNSTSDLLCNSVISCVGNQDQCLKIK
ncbi:urokinase plasminogen activator surface receptor-like isoform X1, partial [Clarias magur]